MTKTLSAVNLKGGVGKTAFAVNFSAYCGRNGLDTLLIDVDPQTNATFSCVGLDEWEEHAHEKGTLANLLKHRSFASAENSEPDVQEIIVDGVFEGVDLIPSHLDLFTVDLDLAGATGRELRLRKGISDIKDEYDIIICDCPPNLTIPTQNALAASTHYLVPISPDFLSGIGVGILLKRIRGFCEDLGHSLEPAGMLISRVGRPATHREQTVQSLRDKFGEKVLETEIKERVAVSESAAQNHSIFDHEDTDAGSEFGSASEEVLSTMDIQT